LIEKLLEAYAPDATIIASGNALRASPVWIQILADVMGREVQLSGLPESSTRGAALLALEATGKIASIEETSVPVEQTFVPTGRAKRVIAKALNGSRSCTRN